MAVGIGVHPKRLLGVVGPVLEQPCPQTQRAHVDLVELRHAVDGQVEVQLLRHLGGGPGRRRQLLDLSDGQHGVAGLAAQVEPLAACDIRLSRRRRLVAGPVDQPEQLAPELRGAPRVGGVDDHLPEDRAHQTALSRNTRMLRSVRDR